MVFVNISLLVGGALIAIPIILHFVMRREPLRLEFPALRFVKQRQRTNQRRVQLRHWLLLLLRCAAIAILAMALARPSVESGAMGDWIFIGILGLLAIIAILMTVFSIVYKAGRGVVIGMSVLAMLLLMATGGMMLATTGTESGQPLGNSEEPVAAAIVIDTSPRMEYVRGGKTRLDEARETARWILTDLLPDSSEVAIIDSSGRPGAFNADIGAAEKRLQGLHTTWMARPLPEAIREAVDLVRANDKKRKEIYVFTDLTDPSWPASSTSEVFRVLQSSPDVSIQLVDVGVEDPKDFALGDIRLANEKLPQNGHLQLSIDVTSTGEKGRRDVDVFLEQLTPGLPLIRDGKVVTPESRRRRRESVALTPGQTQLIRMGLSNLASGVRHGRVELTGGADGLDFNNIRYFTVEAAPPYMILVAGSKEARTKYVTEALAPYEFRTTGRARFECETIPLGKLGTRDLSPFDAVFVLDPTPMQPAVWRRLAEYVRDGGGAAIFLGAAAVPVATFNEEDAQSVLPGRLISQVRAGNRLWSLSPETLSHQLLAAFRPIADSVSWQDFPVQRYWRLGPLAESSRIVIPYSNGAPAMIERSLGMGRVLVMTTPASDPARPKGRDAWNELATGFEPWPFMMLMNETALYLVNRGEEKYNYYVGQSAVLYEESTEKNEDYYLFTPRGGKPELVSPRRGVLTVRFTQTPGTYRLKGVKGAAPRGFSVNVPATVDNLERVSTERLDETLGPNRYQLARGREQIRRQQGEARLGREFFPLLLMVLAVVLGMEYVMANRFYGSEMKVKQPG